MSTFATDRTEELELRLRAIKINHVPSGAKKRRPPGLLFCVIYLLCFSFWQLPEVLP